MFCFLLTFLDISWYSWALVGISCDSTNNSNYYSFGSKSYFILAKTLLLTLQKLPGPKTLFSYI